MMRVKWWYELKLKYQYIRLHEQIVMSNHFHGIIEIINNIPAHTNPVFVRAGLCVCSENSNDFNINYTIDE